MGAEILDKLRSIRICCNTVNEMETVVAFFKAHGVKMNIPPGWTDLGYRVIGVDSLKRVFICPANYLYDDKGALMKEVKFDDFAKQNLQCAEGLKEKVLNHLKDIGATNEDCAANLDANLMVAALKLQMENKVASWGTRFYAITDISKEKKDFLPGIGPKLKLGNEKNVVATFGNAVAAPWEIINDAPAADPIQLKPQQTKPQLKQVKTRNPKPVLKTEKNPAYFYDGTKIKSVKGVNVGFIKDDTMENADKIIQVLVN